MMKRTSQVRAQLAILNDTSVRLAPSAFEQFLTAIDAPVAALPPKMMERLSRRAPWSVTPQNDIAASLAQTPHP